MLEESFGDLRDCVALPIRGRWTAPLVAPSALVAPPGLRPSSWLAGLSGPGDQGLASGRATSGRRPGSTASPAPGLDSGNPPSEAAARPERPRSLNVPAYAALTNQQEIGCMESQTL